MGTTSSLFVTGLQRSGTTLLAELLTRTPRVSLLSQPAPEVGLEAKRAFWRHLGLEPPTYPFGDLFRESRYRRGDFTAFLETWTIPGGELRALVDNGGRRGTGERRLHELSTWPAGGLAETLARLYRHLASDPDTPCCGAKEIVSEELLPHLLERGFAAVLVVRDPRDVLASLNHGEGRRWGGRLKPTLFNVRNWRKSVAYLLHLEDHPSFAWLRYEDLVRAPGKSLERLGRRLGLDPAGVAGAAALAPDQPGWGGNSSHGVHRGVSRASVGRHRELLAPEVRRFVEAACRPELEILGYPTSVRPSEAPRILTGFEDPYPVERPELASYVTEHARHAEDEVRRLELLASPRPNEPESWFLFDSAHRRLATTA